MPENPRALSLQEIAANQKVSAQAQFLRVTSDWSAQVDELIENHVSQLIEKVEVQVDEALTATGHKSRRAASETINQLMRRLRQCRSTEEVAAWLVDSTSFFSGQAALFEVIEKRVRGVCARGFPMPDDASIVELEADLDRAPAFAHTVLERETVIAIGSPAEVSLQVVAILGHSPTEKVHLFPVVIQERAVAILYAAAGGSQAVDGAGLELLAHAAANAVQILAPGESNATRAAEAPELISPELISIDGVNMRAYTGSPKAMFQRALEARARWFARTEVARIRLFHRTALERGRRQRDIYSTLRPAIDAARRSYRQDFLAVSPAMADYLHRELLELAHDDANLLGPEYPGSLV